MIEDFFTWKKKKFQKLIRKYDKEEKENKEKRKYYEDFNKLCNDLDRDGLTKENLIRIGRWKNNYTNRIKHHLEKNNEEDLQELAKKIKKDRKSSQNDPLGTLEGLLNKLIYEKAKNKGIKGVQIPMASAILTMMFPDEYFVIDYKIVNSFLLEKANTAKEHIKNQSNNAVNMENFKECYDKIGELSKNHGLTPRDIEKAIWMWYTKIEGEVKKG